MKKVEFEGSQWFVEPDSFFRFGKYGKVEVQFKSVQDANGKPRFVMELPDPELHLEEDFDVVILVLAWGLWGFAGAHGFLERPLAAITASQFICRGIEQWLDEHDKLRRAEAGDGE